MKTGIHSDIPFKDYLKIDAVSNSYLGRLEKCPANALVEQKETDALNTGRALHFAVEDITRFNKEVVLLPKVNKRTVAGREKLADFIENHQDKVLLTEKDRDIVLEIRDAIYAHPMAEKILGVGGTAEQTAIWKDRETGFLCKARADFIPPLDKRSLVDFKTTANASARAFERSIINYGYARQGASYLDGFNASVAQHFTPPENGVYTEEVNVKYEDFIIIAVEKEEPYHTEIYALGETFIERGRTKYKDLLKLHKECTEKKSFPHYTNEGITVLEAPPYY